MKKELNKTGVTLVEILVVVAIVAILVAMVIGIAARIDTQGKEQLTKNTFALLNTALGEFSDYGYSYAEYPNYAGLKFPPDCNGFSTGDFGTELGWTINPSGAHDPCYSGCEALYFFLSRVPESREILDRIDKKLVTSKDENGNDMVVTVGGKSYLLFRVIDPWGKTLRYSYYDNTKEGPTSEPSRSLPMAFPLIISAGPDRDFNSVVDNITNRD